MKNNLDQPLLSVVVPIGNMSGNLKFIKSWLQEVYKYSLEVVLVHDQTYLNVGKELSELLRTINSARIILVEGVFGNPGSARNAGLEIAQGRWIAFWDSDDNPNIKNIFLAIKTVKADDEILIGNFSVFDFKTLDLKKYTNGIDPINSVAMNPGIWRMIFKSQVINKTRFPALKMAEDQVFLSRLNFAIKDLRFIDLNFYQYNVGNSSQLTQSQGAIQELPLASRLILSHAKKASRNQAIFDMQLFFRQQITIFKKGNFFSKFSNLRLACKFFKESNFIFLIRSLIALIRVLKILGKSGI